MKFVWITLAFILECTFFFLTNYFSPFIHELLTIVRHLWASLRTFLPFEWVLKRRAEELANFLIFASSMYGVFLIKIDAWQAKQVSLKTSQVLFKVCFWNYIATRKLLVFHYITVITSWSQDCKVKFSLRFTWTPALFLFSRK